MYVLAYNRLTSPLIYDKRKLAKKAARKMLVKLTTGWKAEMSFTIWKKEFLIKLETCEEVVVARILEIVVVVAVVVVKVSKNICFLLKVMFE